MNSPKKILVVEDDDDLRELMSRILGRQGYDIAAATDGLVAYDLALDWRPDLIVTDVYMPSADGVHLVRRVRDTPELAATPILVTTGYGSGSATLALSQGADAYEPKPVEPESLLETVRRLLSQGSAVR
ncbi:MAG: response regulator [Pyrinomonadaceae bacterium]